MKHVCLVILLVFAFLVASVPARGAVINCTDCTDCTGKTANATVGDIIQLNASVSNYSGTCISFEGKDSLTFDCLGNTIGGDDDPSYDYGISMGNSSNSLIRNCILTDFGYGLYLYNSLNNTLTNITATSNPIRGIVIITSYNITLTNIIVALNDEGLYMGSSSYIQVTSLTANSNSKDGINLNNASSSTIQSANLYSNQNGISIYQTSMYNIIRDSFVLNNSVGIYLGSVIFGYPSYNTFYNNILNNTVNFFSSNDNNLNYWNTSLNCSSGPNIIGGHCIGGNYWAVPGGGFSETCADSNQDEICDISYTPIINNTDYLPLSKKSSLSITRSINPRSPRPGTNTTISINVTAEKTIDKLILTITMPDSSLDVFQLAGNTTMNYTPSISGLYNVTIFANDTKGYNATVGDSFTASNLTLFNSTVVTYNNTGIPSKIELYYTGTSSIISSFTSDSGSFLNKEIPEQNYDIQFRSYDDNLQVILKNVNITQNPDRIIGFDNPAVQNYTITYAVSNNYTLSSATVKIFYSGINEDHIGLYKCDGWNFAGRVCDGSWNPASFVQDKNQDYVSFDVTSFSAFSLKQEPFCGDNICQENENASTCNLDCDCTENETMECGISVGECRKGNLTCHNGRWGTECIGAVLPKKETCNGKDDDCDGLIDEDLTESCGNSIGACKPGIRTCMDGAWGECVGVVGPAAEKCNGIDDDCDGVIDNGADCCTNGETRNCGASLSAGICHPGTSTCTGSKWSECTGAVAPEAEVCNDGLDNDCDGLTDSEDPDCSHSTCGNGVMDGNETGIDCGGDCAPCTDYSMIWISVTGAVIFGVFVFLYFKLRKQGKELTWEEIMRKWAPAPKGYTPR